MQFKNILLLLSSALFVFACSSTKPPVEDTASASVDLMQKGFLLSLPESEGWSVVKKTDYKVLLSRQTPGAGYTIQSLVVTLPIFEEDTQFLDYVKSRITESNKNDKVLEQNTSMSVANNEVCVIHTSKKEKKAKSMVLEVASYTCRHPNNAEAGVYMALSKNYAPGTSDENLMESATELFNRLYFTEL